jgi:hypothetical protein
MGAEVRGIKRRVVEASERRVRYKVDGVAAELDGPAVDSLRFSALYTKAAELVGIGERSDELVRMLMECVEASSRQLKVVSIAGFGGLGRTTLAKIVYEKLKGQFDCAAYCIYAEKYWYQVYQSMGSGVEESTVVKDMRRILSISYYALPPHLKTCLLYLTLYSEDYGIMREGVICKWVCEGSVQKQHGKTLYEVGRRGVL